MTQQVESASNSPYLRCLRAENRFYYEKKSTPCLLESSADNLSKQFGARIGPKLFDTLMVEIFFQPLVYFVKKQTTKHAKLSCFIQFHKI